SELEHNFPALTSAFNKLENSHSDKSNISSSSQSTNPDWSKAITWAQVAAMKSPLSKEKKIGMAWLTTEEAESVMDESMHDSSAPPLHSTMRTQNFQPNYYKSLNDHNTLHPGNKRSTLKFRILRDSEKQKDANGMKNKMSLS
ncbi:hypothetical protein KI387_015683, partial [Taxus chinensis]